MMWRLAALLIWLASPVWPSVISVESGEHADFSRLVLTLPAPQDWRLGRTETGYELTVGMADQPYDISGVFELIPKDRLTGIYVDPTTGKLQLTVGCDCHALSFSLDAQTIVIDLRDGPPPPRSEFEKGLNGSLFPPLRDENGPIVRPRFRTQASKPELSYNWLLEPKPALPQHAPLDVPVVVDEGEKIRQALVVQLADGAAQGVVDLALPLTTNVEDAPFLAEDVSIRLSNTPGLQISGERVDEDLLQPDGSACIEEEVLDLAGWGNPLGAYEQLARLHGGLVGEFDRPDQDAVLDAARHYLFLGFGAEAQNMLTAFAIDSTETSLLGDMARIVDASAVAEDNAFAGMANCDTAAALWSFLARPDTPLSQVNLNAVKRSFSALPLHLRQHLGPRIVDVMIAQEATDDAHEIIAAIGRGDASDDRAAQLVEAELALAEGDAQSAVENAEVVLDDAGQFAAQALITLIDAKIAAGEVVDPELAETAEAMIAEHQGDPLQPVLQKTYQRALAGSGQFVEAFALAGEEGKVEPDIWLLLARLGSDEDLLQLAFMPPDEVVPEAAATQVADRLAGLGFTDAAAEWRRITGEAGPAEAVQDAEETAVLAETAVLTETDVSGTQPVLGTSEVVPITTSDADRALRWGQDWPRVAAAGDDTWAQLARQLLPAEGAAPLPPLAAAGELLSQSQSTRALIDALLLETAASRE